MHLDTDGPALALVVGSPSAPTATTDTSPVTDTPRDRICHVLAEAGVPLALGELRARCHMRTATLCDTLGELTREKTILETPAGYALSA